MHDDPMNIERMAADMNRSMPVDRRSASDYLENGDLVFRTKDGGSCSFGASELGLVASNCTETEKIRLRLPIFVSTDASCAEGAWKIEGRTEVSVISKMLGKTPRREDYLRLYHPDLKELKKMIPGLIAVLFLP
ncbi:MAG: DUF61 family protein [Candidatus Methanoplasma sp.]|jgi:uncharacterized protein (UPF0216 family)|nr:DUF61 family protein [Candidatus Methanoplasma sp.]